jgi:F-type H+-transporting ATPase subunit b
MLELPPDMPVFCAQIILFVVFAFALNKLILQPTQTVLREREQRTSGAQDEADRMRQEASALRAKLEERLREARHAGSAAGEEIRRKAEASEQEALDEARQEAARLLEEVRARIQSESDVARLQLREQSAALARAAAEKILSRPVHG